MDSSHARSLGFWPRNCSSGKQCASDLSTTSSFMSCLMPPCRTVEDSHSNQHSPTPPALKQFLWQPKAVKHTLVYTAFLVDFSLSRLGKQYGTTLKPHKGCSQGIERSPKALFPTNKEHVCLYGVTLTDNSIQKRRQIPVLLCMRCHCCCSTAASHSLESSVIHEVQPRARLPTRTTSKSKDRMQAVPSTLEQAITEYQLQCVLGAKVQRGKEVWRNLDS
eukprot:284077-Amphidinium_carterae.1